MMSLEEIFARIERLQLDSRRIADALHAHHRELAPSSPAHAPLQRLFQVISDFHLVLALSPRPSNA
jgi:hypothetical protein